jgi:hypothetical protein
MRTGRPVSSWDSLDDLRSRIASALLRVVVAQAIAVTPVFSLVLSEG